MASNNTRSHEQKLLFPKVGGYTLHCYIMDMSSQAPANQNTKSNHLAKMWFMLSPMDMSKLSRAYCINTTSNG